MSEISTLLQLQKNKKFDGKLYELKAFAGRGNSGDVYKVESEGKTYALKVFFPYYAVENQGANASIDVPRLIQRVQQMQEREHSTLADIDHPNIVHVYGTGTIELSAEEKEKLEKKYSIKLPNQLPSILAAFIEGWDLKEAIEAGYLNTAEQIAYALYKSAIAIDYLHLQKDYLHADIRPENIIIRDTDREPILIDFALSKNLNPQQIDSDGLTSLEGDWDLFPNLQDNDPLRIIKERGGTREDLKKHALPALDFFQYGKLIQSLFRFMEPNFEVREVNYLRTTYKHLIDWNAVTQIKVGGLAPRIARLGAEKFSPFNVAELGETGTTDRSIMIPPGISIPITSTIQDIIESRSWRRLTTVNQLSFLSQVYPGADYKRSVHVLYSYEICRKLILNLYGDPAFRWMFGATDVLQALIVTLLHDINHFPFLHIFQEMEDRQSKIPGYDSIDLFDLFCDGVITGEKDNGEKSVYELAADVGIGKDRLRRLLMRPHHEQNSDQDALISSIINSGVDIDKLSYLRLDSHFTGVNYGAALDYNALYGQACVHHLDDSHSPHIAFKDGAIQAVENVVMTRFWHFRAMYWHHTNRAAMAMLLRVAHKVFTEGGVNFQDYLEKTLWSGDIGALKYLDEQHETIYGKKSIIGELYYNRRSLYKRIYTLRLNEKNNNKEQSLYNDMKNISLSIELKICTEIAKKISELVDAPAGGLDVDDVLIDIPGRRMDSGGDVFVVLGSGAVENLNNVSEPIRNINENYKHLAKRARLFASPRLVKRLRNKFGMAFTQTQQQNIYEIIKESVVQNTSKSTIN